MNIVNKTPLRKLPMSIRKYRPRDNSYATCLNDGINHHIAGMFRTPGKTVEVVLGPYYKTLIPFHGVEGVTHEFVIVQDDEGLYHEVLFSERYYI